MSFDKVIGNARVKKILRLALERNRVPGSLLFSGPQGVGKRSLARFLAQAINCEREKTDACGVCSTCLAISGRRFPDVCEIEPEGQGIKIEQMRALKRTAYLHPMLARKRIFIIDEAEKMTEEAANSLLKILEEPPAFSHIILLTSNLHLILPTILSRCQILHFVPVGKEEIRKVLTERGYPEDQARLLSLIAGGNLERALGTEWEKVQVERQEAWDIFLSFVGKQGLSSFFETYAFAPRSLVREELERTLEILASFGRDLMLLQVKGEPALMLNPDFAPKIGALQKEWSLEKSWRFLERVDQGLSGLEKNLNLSLLVSTFYALAGGV